MIIVSFRNEAGGGIAESSTDTYNPSDTLLKWERRRNGNIIVRNNCAMPKLF